MKVTPFRMWCQNLWMANADERSEMGFDRIDMSEYFRRYKFWLKREYRYQQTLND
jgi:hypothetical protein